MGLLFIFLIICIIIIPSILSQDHGPIERPDNLNVLNSIQLDSRKCAFLITHGHVVEVENVIWQYEGQQTAEEDFRQGNLIYLF